MAYRPTTLVYSVPRANMLRKILAPLIWHENTYKQPMKIHEVNLAHFGPKQEPNQQQNKAPKQEPTNHQTTYLVSAKAKDQNTNLPMYEVKQEITNKALKTQENQRKTQAKQRNPQENLLQKL